MPELPEVETIACGLRPELEGREFVAVDVRNSGSVHGDRHAFDCCVLNRRITTVGRRGKLLLIHLAAPEDDDTTCKAALEFAETSDLPDMLAFHLRMSGRLFMYDADQPAGVHTRLIFTLDNGRKLFFDDARKFGSCRALSPDSRPLWKFWATLGPEPLEIGRKEFIDLFRGRRKAMKALLLDQTVIAGVGNIYADESLFRAGIRPDTRPAEWSAQAAARRLGRLYDELREVLHESIRECGSSIRDYRDAKGDAGAFQNSFRVYGRSGQQCVVCKDALTTAKVAGRTTVYCVNCQK
ncbi:bifunctional DNA-formamidopyrimidine glycosylase/DNA-(apurinic or apyrimidinic site) lyase [Oleidesulfovibrio sp.]|uniref:bifunctional DNA-formamidopyrimidine glycosylase/DNA-(apurinic or apyrimidinic site) lyase n=1 Tax=Oleidesulfovibrio sp. TaxID=2909707 RepID=UPI003A88A7FB